MLVLSRRYGEKVYIKVMPGQVPAEGLEIVVTVVDIDRGKVRIGFNAPKEVAIAREEVRDENWKGGGGE